MVIQPVRNRHDHAKALKRIEALWNAEKGTPQGDELEVLSILVEHYEETHDNVLPPDPVDAIKYRMEQMGFDNSQLAACLGGKNRVSEIMNRRRGLSVRMIAALHMKLHIPPESLLRYPRTISSARRHAKRTALSH